MSKSIATTIPNFQAAANKLNKCSKTAGLKTGMGMSMSLSVQEALFYLQRKENPGAPGCHQDDSEGKHSKGSIHQTSKLDVQ